MASKTTTVIEVTQFQDELKGECLNRNLREPEWQVYSDRRGGRTAWSASVTIGNMTVAARLWYDGQYINSAKEECSQLAIQTMRARGSPGYGQPPKHNGAQQAVAGQAQRW